MTNTTSTTPKWINIYLWLTLLITLGASLAGYFKPDALLGDWEAISAAGALSLAGPLGLFVSRNMATAVVTFYGLVSKNISMIKIILVLRIVSDGLDAVNNIVADNMPVAGMAIVMCLIEVFAFISLNKK